MRQLLFTLAAFAAGATLAASSAAGSNAPVQVNFVKHVADPVNLVFEGSTSGAVTGSLTSRLVNLTNVSGPIYHITFDWVVSASDRSFTARTTGIWNTVTGAVVTNGTVVSRGYLSGARVHEEGRLVDPSALMFEGFLRLMPPAGNT